MRLKRSAVLLEHESDAPMTSHGDAAATLYESRDSLEEPRAWPVRPDELPTLRALATGGAHAIEAVDDSVVARWRALVPDLVRDDTVDEELAALRAFAADRRFMLEMFSASEAMAAPQDTEAFHEQGIDDADVNFDDVETTLAHLFARPTAALRQRHYGAAFCDEVLDELLPDAATRDVLRIAELGCGTGRFAHDFLARLRERAPQLYARTRYTLVDLAPTLQASQRRRCAPHGDRCAFVLGNLLQHVPAREEERYDVVISNEVIADLPVRACYRDDVAFADNEASACVRRWELSMAGLPHATLINTGAIELIERLHMLLHDNGVAVVTEYGNRTRGPVRVVLGDHVEHSIHYGHLEQVAARCGLRAHTARVVDLLRFDEDMRALDLENLDVLRRAIGPALGLAPLPRMTFSVDDIRTWLGVHAPTVHHLVDVPLRTHAMRADLFLALVARKA